MFDNIITGVCMFVAVSFLLGVIARKDSGYSKLRDVSEENNLVFLP